MKTKNNVHKAILKSLSVLTSLVIISITVNAQDLWKSILEKYNFNDIELAMVDNNSKALLAETDANGFEFLIIPEIEESLKMEKWMADDSYFTTSFSMEKENENPLELEDWMTNKAMFNSNSIYLEVETEEALELEYWMKDSRNFEVTTLRFIEETETELKIEDWMTKEELFTTSLEIEQPLELEPWMVSEKIW
jgi:hypothetical protein